MQHMNSVFLVGQFIGQLASSIRGIVVNDEDVRCRMGIVKKLLNQSPQI